MLASVVVRAAGAAVVGSVASCDGVQLLMDLLDPVLDVAAQPVDHGLVLLFPLFVLFEHAEEQIDVKHRPYPLLHGQLQELREVRFHGSSPPLRESLFRFTGTMVSPPLWLGKWIAESSRFSFAN